MKDNYTKVVYESSPIGKEKIRLYLTTFDLEKFKEDEELREIPQQRKAIEFEFDIYNNLSNPNLVNKMQKQLEEYINHTYKQQIEEMKIYIEQLRAIKMMPQLFEKR